MGLIRVSKMKTILRKIKDKLVSDKIWLGVVVVGMILAIMVSTSFFAQAIAVSFTDLDTPEISDGVDRTSYDSASWTPPDALIIVFVVSVRTASIPDQPTMSGNGITWTAIKTVLSQDSTTRTTLFGANGSGASAGVTTVDFGGQTQRDCSASFLQADGTDVGNGVAQTFVQSPTNTTDGSPTSISITLAAAGDSDNRPVAGFASHGAGSAITPRTNWTEYFESLPDSHNAEAQYRSDAFETTASMSDGTGPHEGIAAEIKAVAVAAVLPLQSEFFFSKIVSKVFAKNK